MANLAACACGGRPHLAPVLLRKTRRATTGKRRMRNLFLALATLAGVLLVAANAAHGF